MAAALDRTGGNLSIEMMTYYEKVFLARAMEQLVYDQGAQKKTHGKNQGKSIVFTRYTPMSKATTALSEGANPSVTLLTGANVSCTLAEYGNTAKISKFLSLTSIDRNNAEKIELLGQNMGETINRLVGLQLSQGFTEAFANSKKASTIKTSDTLDATDVRTIVQNLEGNQASPFADGYFIGKVQPKSKTGLVLDTTWVNGKTYSDVKDLYRGEMGELYQVRFLLSTNKMSEAGSGSSSTVVTYHNYIHGRDSFGVYDLEGDPPKLYVLPNPVDSNNPTGRFALISWAGTHVTKVLNGDWGYNLRSA